MRPIDLEILEQLRYTSNGGPDELVIGSGYNHERGRHRKTLPD